MYIAQTPTTPGVTISALVRAHVARCIFVAGPVSDQIDWTEGVLLGEGHVLNVATLTWHGQQCRQRR